MTRKPDPADYVTKVGYPSTRDELVQVLSSKAAAKPEGGKS